MIKQIIIGTILIGLINLIPICSWAQSPASPNFYSSVVSENSAIIALNRPTLIIGAAALNFDTSNPKTVMLFDAISVPSAGTSPLVSFPAATASSSSSSLGSFPVPVGGIQTYTGLVAVCSTTPKTLTADTGNNCKFEISWR